MPVEISLEELDALNNAIKQRQGIDFTQYEPKSFARRVSRAIDYFKMDGLMGLWGKLLSDRDFLFDFIDQVTVGMTSMFRDPQLWKALKTGLLFELKNQPNINIWHAGCSTGEEVYSLGIVLQDLKIQDKVTAYATDLNRNSIEKCKNGIYDKLALDQNVRQFRDYNAFKKLEDFYQDIDDRNYKMNPDLIKHVKFEVSNLVSDPVKNGPYDIIFIRNVMIYFDETLKRKILDKIYDNLKPGGFMVIGYFDAILPVLDRTKFEYYDLKSKIFRKI